MAWMRQAPNPQRHRRDPGQSGAVNLKTGKPSLAAGYAKSTINHALTVIGQFYEFHRHTGDGPLVNPVPVGAQRRQLLAHHSPMEPPPLVRRAPLRQKLPHQQPRSIPDALWQELFDSMRCTRDRALLACYVCSGARASELLGLRTGDIDWAGMRMWLARKGSDVLSAVPLSPQAAVLLAAYLSEAGLPPAGSSVWRTVRGSVRPLNYWAVRRMLQRANAALGTNWTLHDLRHTTCARMADDPSLTLPEIQTVMRPRAVVHHAAVPATTAGRADRQAPGALPAPRTSAGASSWLRLRRSGRGVRWLSRPPRRASADASPASSRPSGKAGFPCRPSSRPQHHRPHAAT